MNAYPAEFVQQHHPLMLVGGLLHPQQGQQQDAGAPTPNAASSGLTHPAEAFPQLCSQLVTILSSKGRSTTWDPNPHRSNMAAAGGGGGGGSVSGGNAGGAAGGSSAQGGGGSGRAGPTFRTILVPDNFRLPPRKVRLQPLPGPGSSPTGSSASSAPVALPPGTALMRSALSPLHPQSPLYPDGLISPLWVRKHRDVIPSIFVLFQVLPQATSSSSSSTTDDGVSATVGRPSSETDTNESDLALIRYISNLRQLLTSRSIKLTVVLLTSRASLAHPTLEPRLSHLRRTSGLDSKGSLFVLTPVSEVDLHDFIASLQTALAEASTDYYREQGRRVRRKRGKYPPAPSAYGSPADTPIGTPPPVALLSKEGWTLRSAYKLGTFAELSGDLSLSLEHYVNAYDVLSSTAHPHNGGLLGDTRVLPPRTKRWAEAKALADSLVIRIARGWLLLGLEAHTFTVPVPSGEGSAGDAEGPPLPEKTKQIQVHLPSREAWERALGTFRAHLKRFGELSNGWGMGESTGEWWSWVGKQYRLFADLVDSIVRSYRHAPISLSTILPEHCPPLPSNLLHPGALSAYSAAMSAATAGTSRSGPTPASATGSAGSNPTGHDRTSSISRNSTMPPLAQSDPTGSNNNPGTLSLATSLALTLTGPAPLAPSPLASKSGVAPAAGVVPHPGQWYLLAALCAEERWRRWRNREERERVEGRTGDGREDDPSTAVERKADHGALVIEALSKAYECFKRPSPSPLPSSRSRTASYVAARMAHAYALSNQPGLALSFAQRVLVPFRGSIHVNPAGSRPAPGRSDGILLDLLIVGAVAAAQLEEQAALEKETSPTGAEGVNANGVVPASAELSASAKSELGMSSAAQYRATRLRLLWEALGILSSQSSFTSRVGLQDTVERELAWLLYEAPSLMEDGTDAVVLESSVPAHGSLFRAEAVFWEESIEVGQEVRVQVRLHALGESEPEQRVWRFGRLEVDVDVDAKEGRTTFGVEHQEDSAGDVIQLGKDEIVKATLQLDAGAIQGPLVLEGSVKASHTGSLRVSGVRLFVTDGPTPCIIQLTPFTPDLVYAGLPARQALWYLPAPHNRFLRLNHRLGLTECIVKARTYAVRITTTGSDEAQNQTVYLDEKFGIEVEIANEEVGEDLEGFLDVVCRMGGAAAEDGNEQQVDIIAFEDQTSRHTLSEIPLGVIPAGGSTKKKLSFQATAFVGPRHLRFHVRIRPSSESIAAAAEGSPPTAKFGTADEKTHELALSVVHPFESHFSIAWNQEPSFSSFSTAAIDGEFLSAEDEVFVHPDGTPNGALARLSAEFRMRGAHEIEVEGAILTFGSAEGMSTVRRYDATGRVEPHAHRLQVDWSEDVEGEWAEGDRFVAHSQIEVARDPGFEIDMSRNPGAVELRWRRRTEGAESTRTVIPLPPIVAPPSPSVSITLFPPTYVRLGQPFLLRGVVKNDQPFRTADVRLEMESSESFVFAGARKMTIPALLPRSERKVAWRLLGRQAGWVPLPTIRAEDWRAKSVAEGPGSGAGDEGFGVTGAMPEQRGGRIPVFDGRRLGSCPVIPVGSSSGGAMDVMQDELRQAMGSPPPSLLANGWSSVGAGAGAGAGTSNVLMQPASRPPAPSAIVAQQQQQNAAAAAAAAAAASSKALQAGLGGPVSLGPVRAPGQSLLLVLP
ncbi:hypothetical protein CF327_g7215 [Tilletia walkeri]|nr:hypothetical protein CF327_g7215 [Tilletia walkeri]